MNEEEVSNMLKHLKEVNEAWNIFCEAERRAKEAYDRWYELVTRPRKILGGENAVTKPN